ncbi:MAG TPA: hypothetical protein VGF39_16905 [Stellaceae bacterium]|jgi:aromatic ring hydroxylase
MAIRTGEQLLQSLRAGRQLFIDGDRVKDVTTDPRFAAAPGASQSFTICSTIRH